MTVVLTMVNENDLHVQSMYRKDDVHFCQIFVNVEEKVRYKLYIKLQKDFRSISFVELGFLHM